MSDLDTEYRNERVARATVLLNQGVKPKRSPDVYRCYNCTNGTRRHVFDGEAFSHSGIIPICPNCEKILTNTPPGKKSKRQPKLPQPPANPFIFLNPQPVSIIFVDYECWKCNKPGHIYYVSCAYVSEDGEVMNESTAPGFGQSPFTDHFRPEIIKTAQEFCSSPQGQHIRLGEIKLRYSKTVDETYNSFGCYWCDAIFGNFHINDYILTEWLVLDRVEQERNAAAIVPTTIDIEKNAD